VWSLSGGGHTLHGLWNVRPNVSASVFLLMIFPGGLGVNAQQECAPLTVIPAL
jgi:hypothetical protein